MNFVFMIILILIILLFFNIYLNHIKNSFYTALILFVLIINEIYFSKIEKFEQAPLPYRMDYDFKQQLNKQMCIFDEQKNIIENKIPINSKCHKILNRRTCDMYKECEYDTEFNKCNNKSKCTNIETKPLKCNYMDDKETCNNLAQKMPKCEIYKKSSCIQKKECNWNERTKNCDYKDITCIKLGEDECESDNNNKS